MKKEKSILRVRRKENEKKDSRRNLENCICNCWDYRVTIVDYRRAFAWHSNQGSPIWHAILLVQVGGLPYLAVIMIGVVHLATWLTMVKIMEQNGSFENGRRVSSQVNATVDENEEIEDHHAFYVNTSKMLHTSIVNLGGSRYLCFECAWFIEFKKIPQKLI